MADKVRELDPQGLLAEENIKHAQEENDVGMKPAAGVIMTRPAMTPIKIESSDHLSISNCVMHGLAMGPPQAQRFVMHCAMMT